MNRFSLLVVTALLALGCAHADAPSTGGEASSVVVKLDAASSESAQGAIRNTSGRELQFYCAVEQQLDGEWREVVPSIEASKVSKAVRLTKLAADQEHKFAWSPKSTAAYPVKVPGTFRLKVYIHDVSGTPTKEIITSAEFALR